MIFQEIDGLWVAVDSACQIPPTLAETLDLLHIVIDDNCKFCRIIRNISKVKKTIEYRHMVEKSDLISYKAKTNKILSFIVRYNILRDGKSVENGIKGWRTALAHARKWQQDLFYNVRKVEILNLWTGEIITLQEAEQRAKIYAQKP